MENDTSSISLPISYNNKLYAKEESILFGNITLCEFGVTGELVVLYM